LCQLADDKHYFPPYQAVFLVRSDAMRRNPVLAGVMSQLNNAISTDDMRQMNYAVDGRKEDRREVVRRWLLGKGL